MTASDVATLLLALPVGMAAGLLYYGGLWMTLQRLHRTRHPAALVMLSLLVRLTLVATLFYMLITSLWLAFVPLLIGFLAVRAWMVRRLRPPDADSIVAAGTIP